jgi:hypothetical protein
MRTVTVRQHRHRPNHYQSERRWIMASNTLSNPDSDDNAAAIYSPLSQSPWPRFPDVPIALNAVEASRLYRMAFGVTGLVRLLNRSMQLRGAQEDFADATGYPLSPCDESSLWCALATLSTDLVYLAEDIHSRALEGTTG